MPHNLKHVETSQSGFQGQPHHHHEHFKIHRLNDGLPADKSHYLLAAFGEVHPGKPVRVPAHHIGPTVVYVIEGELHVEDHAHPGEIIKLAAGDVLHVEEGTRNISTTPSKCKFIGVCYVPAHLHPEDLIVEKH